MMRNAAANRKWQPNCTATCDAPTLLAQWGCCGRCGWLILQPKVQDVRRGCLAGSRTGCRRRLASDHVHLIACSATQQLFKRAQEGGHACMVHQRRNIMLVAGTGMHLLGGRPARARGSTVPTTEQRGSQPCLPGRHRLLWLPLSPLAAAHSCHARRRCAQAVKKRWSYSCETDSAGKISVHQSMHAASLRACRGVTGATAASVRTCS